MVREFTLVDGSGEEYSLTNEEHLLYNPSGLGFEHENTYRQVGNRFILANSVPKQSVISGTVHFSAPDAYYDYQEFIEFCGRDNLKMEYRLSEMPSRKTKRLTGTVDWIVLANGEKYSGTYDFITGDYELTEKILECDANTVINVERQFANGYSTLYSISIAPNRNATDLIYCNGIPASSTDSAIVTYDQSSNKTYIGGSVNKIYFALHPDALQGKTISQWIVDNKVIFSYTLETPITGNNATYKFNPKLMYNPMVSFYGLNIDGSLSVSNGEVSYENKDQEIITLEGTDLILENSELGQELISLKSKSNIVNKNANSRFEYVGTNLCNSANRAALNTGSAPGHFAYSSSTDPITFVYTNLPVAYLTDGLHRFEGKFFADLTATYQVNRTGYALVKFYYTLELVYKNQNDEYEKVTSLKSGSFQKFTYFDHTATGFPVTNVINGIDISYGFSKQNVNSNIYLKLSLTVDYSYEGPEESWALINSNAMGFSNFRVESASLTGSTYNEGQVPLVSDIKLSSNKSIAQISQADSQHYQRAVRLNKVEKTELTKFSSLETKVEFECLEPWGDPFTSFVEHGTSPDPVNSITFDTDCHALSPCDLYISGPCTNPTWIQTVNGVEVTTGGYTGTIASGEQLLIRAKDGACGIYLINGSGNIDDVYKYSDFSKDRFVFIRYGENVITVTDGTDPTTQIDCYIEGELYYESV